MKSLINDFLNNGAQKSNSRMNVLEILSLLVLLSTNIGSLSQKFGTFCKDALGLELNIVYPMILIITIIVCYFLITNKKYDSKKLIGFNQEENVQIVYRHSQVSRLLAKLFLVISLILLPISIINSYEKQKKEINPLAIKQLMVHNGIDTSGLVNIILHNKSKTEVFVNSINLEGIQHFRGGYCYAPRPRYYKIGDELFIFSQGESGNIKGFFKGDDNPNILNTPLRGNYVIDKCRGYKAIYMKLQTKIIIKPKNYAEVYLQMPALIKLQMPENQAMLGRHRNLEIVEDKIIDSLLFDSPLEFDSLRIEFITDQQKILKTEKIRI